MLASPNFLQYSWLSGNETDFECPEIPSVSERRQFEEVSVDLKGLSVYIRKMTDLASESHQQDGIEASQQRPESRRWLWTKHKL